MLNTVSDLERTFIFECFSGGCVNLRMDTKNKGVEKRWECVL